jgi:hypothetical protein
MRNTTARCGRKVSRAVVPTIRRVLFRCCSVVGKLCLYLRTAVGVQEELIAKFSYNYLRGRLLSRESFYLQFLFPDGRSKGFAIQQVIKYLFFH